MSYRSEILYAWSGSLLLLPLVILLIVNHGSFIFILDHINLLFHEGGHGVFKLFGKFIHALGGTLMQIIIPSLFIIYFLWNKKRFGVQLSLVYLAQNLMNISVYIGDAVERKLPLLGGNKVYHDWNYLLAEMNVLSYEKTISDVVFYFAVIVCLFSLLIPIFWRNYNYKNISLNL